MSKIYINDIKHELPDVAVECILENRRKFNELSVNHAYLEANHDLLKTELAEQKAKDLEQYNEWTTRVEIAEAELAAAKEENEFLKRHYKNVDARLERLLIKLTSQSDLKAKNKELRDALTALKIRIAFIGWPSEPKYENKPDWRKEIAIIEQTLQKETTPQKPS
ncbi:hypothetical protein LCGC14_1146190 [marine sediment metagenome]|uniref:Uncharacterized protein n=1 Tax=marine sediment metagenome TaxID=412755 RepID=A0A0F9LWR6_9ZZZZ